MIKKERLLKLKLTKKFFLEKAYYRTFKPINTRLVVFIILFRMYLIVILSLLLIYFVLLYKINGGYQPKGSPAIYRGWIPYLGEVINVSKLTLPKLVEKYSKENNGIFSLYMLGETYTYIADPDAFQSIWKDPKVGFGPIKERIGSRLRGFEEETSVSVEESEKRSDIDRKNTIQYLMGNELNNLTIKYQILADKKIDELVEGNNKLQLLDFTRKVVYYASSKSLLNESFDSDKTLNDFFYYDDMSKLLIIGIPQFLVKKVIAARDRVTKEIEKLNIKECSQVVKSFALVQPDQKMMNSKAMSLLFASQTNSVNSSFWLLLYVLKNKEIKKRIIEEINEFYDPKDIKSIDKMETLNNSFWEACRVAANHLSFREALEDLTVTVYGKDYVIPKGNVIVMWPTTLMDEKMWENPEEFNPDRHKNVSKTAKQAFIPFGGGKHLCPGRYFAMNEAKLFTISMLQRFIIEFSNDEIPEPVKTGGGFVFPNHDIPIIVTKK